MPVFGVELAAIIPAGSAEAVATATSDVCFASVLSEAETEGEAAISEPVKGEPVKGSAPYIATDVLQALEKPVEEVPPPFQERDAEKEAIHSDAAAIAYAFVATMPEAPAATELKAPPVQIIDRPSAVPASPLAKLPVPETGDNELVEPEGPTVELPVNTSEPERPRFRGAPRLDSQRDPQRDIEAEERQEPVRGPEIPVPAVPDSAGQAVPIFSAAVPLQTIPAPDQPRPATTNLVPGKVARPAAPAPVQPANDVATLPAEFSPRSAEPVHIAETPTRDLPPPSSTPVVLEARITAKSTEKPAADDLETTSSDNTAKPSENLERRIAIQRPAFTRHEKEQDGEREPTPSEAPAKRTDTVPAASKPPEVTPAIAPRTANSEVVRQPFVAAEEGLASTQPKTPLKQIEVRIPDANGDVTVRLQERAGALQVTVRSADTQVAGSIAEGLPELSRNLDQQGFQAETWTPQPGSGETVEASARPESTITEQSGFENEDSQRQRNSQDNPEQQEEKHKRPKRPTEEEFEEYL